MPRKGGARPITAEWKSWVRDRINEMVVRGDIKNDAAFAKLAKISPSTLTETLKPEAVQTTVMSEIHKALGWPPPLTCPPVHVLELVQFFERLGEMDQGRWLERLRAEVASAKSRQR